MRGLIPSDTWQRRVSVFQGEKKKKLVELIRKKKGVLKKPSKKDEPSLFSVSLNSKIKRAQHREA